MRGTHITNDTSHLDFSLWSFCQVQTLCQGWFNHSECQTDLVLGSGGGEKPNCWSIIFLNSKILRRWNFKFEDLSSPLYYNLLSIMHYWNCVRSWSLLFSCINQNFKEGFYRTVEENRDKLIRTSELAKLNMNRV